MPKETLIVETFRDEERNQGTSEYLGLHEIETTHREFAVIRNGCLSLEYVPRTVRVAVIKGRHFAVEVASEPMFKRTGVRNCITIPFSLVKQCKVPPTKPQYNFDAE